MCLKAIKRTIKRKNPIAKTLRNPKYRARVVLNKKIYSRKGKENEIQTFRHISDT